VAWHEVDLLTLGRRDECKLTQVGHGRGRGAGRVECRGERLAAVAVCDRRSKREWSSIHTSHVIGVIMKV